jgi:acyl-CoA dehydrogenase
VVYGQLILENAVLSSVSDDIVDQIFDFMVRDFSKFALQLYAKSSSTELQMELCQRMIRKANVDTERYQRVLNTHVYPLQGAYSMAE